MGIGGNFCPLGSKTKVYFFFYKKKKSRKDELKSPARLMGLIILSLKGMLLTLSLLFKI
jgi:hypothetical protein